MIIPEIAGTKIFYWWLIIVLTPFGNNPDKYISYGEDGPSQCREHAKIVLSSIDKSQYKKVQALCCIEDSCYPAELNFNS